ncbi:MAG TPA: hypothetical protein VLF67_00760 [Candidatus Saccharimonas sp.]|nr:hypothetical protein [Candidatus Saccharimonas sp.]
MSSPHWFQVREDPEHPDIVELEFRDDLLDGAFAGEVSYRSAGDVEADTSLTDPASRAIRTMLAERIECITLLSATRIRVDGPDDWEASQVVDAAMAAVELEFGKDFEDDWEPTPN